MKSRSSFYEVINFKGKKLIASPEREFVYLLLLNIPNVDNHKPFYVGYAQNLVRRLANHAQVNWHYNKFETPVQVFIVGTVNRHKVQEAAENLTHLLDNNGYLLSNVIPARKNISLEIMNKEDIIEYASTQTTDTVLPLASWGETWEVKTASPSQIAAEKNENIYNISRQEIHDYINGLEMTGTVRTLANKILETYDESTGTATFIFQKEDKPIINRLNHIWFVAQQKYRHPVKVKLTKRTAETIVALR